MKWIISSLRPLHASFPPENVELENYLAAVSPPDFSKYWLRSSQMEQCRVEKSCLSCARHMTNMISADFLTAWRESNSVCVPDCPIPAAHAKYEMGDKVLKILKEDLKLIINKKNKVLKGDELGLAFYSSTIRPNLTQLGPIHTCPVWFRTK